MNKTKQISTDSLPSTAFLLKLWFYILSITGKDFFIKCDYRTIDTKGPSTTVLLLLKGIFTLWSIFPSSERTIRELFRLGRLAHVWCLLQPSDLPVCVLVCAFVVLKAPDEIHSFTLWNKNPLYQWQRRCGFKSIVRSKTKACEYQSNLLVSIAIVNNAQLKCWWS